MQKRATAREVAAAAGVSKWTVQRAFTEGASIAEDAKRRVLEAAAALNYTPNLLARSLATNHTHQVAVFVDDFANPQKIPYLEILTDSLQANGLVALLVNINTRFDHVRALLNADQRQVDAVILFGTAFRDDTLRDRKLGRGAPPTFVLARDSQIEGVPAVDCDAELALSEIVDHLFSRGYRRPGFMSGAKVLSTALGRREHFASQWAKRGIGLHIDLDAAVYSAEAGADAMRRYLSATAPEDRVDVLMCENDILAMGAMDAIRSEFHLRVPTDIAVVGFDNFDLCGVPAYGLTTYQQPIREMVTAVVEMVLGRREPQTVRLPGKLVVRQTS
jgi:LacI family transcriptional regulator